MKLKFPARAAQPLPVPARVILTTPEHLAAFGFGAGLAPWAPGTAGTLVAVPLWLLLSLLPVLPYVIVVAVLLLFAVWACGASARLLGVHDHGGIVLDEIAGFCVAATPLLPALGLVQDHRLAWVAAAFVLFRTFDIAKPWPIGWLDRTLPGGAGIVGDDLLAGVYAALPLAAAAAVL